ncbi:hypothetical protein LINGRAHAP2_LOCUS28822 [Linum grandiflorum]
MRDEKISVVASTKLAVIVQVEDEDREMINNLISSPVPPSAATIGADSSCFSTPKAKEYQIPDPSTCPPPPTTRKRCYLSPASGPLKSAKVHNAKRKIMFFRSPEVESAVNFGNLLAVETFRISTKGNSTAPKYFR